MLTKNQSDLVSIFINSSKFFVTLMSNGFLQDNFSYCFDAKLSLAEFLNARTQFAHHKTTYDSKIVPNTNNNWQ